MGKFVFSLFESYFERRGFFGDLVIIKLVFVRLIETLFRSQQCFTLISSWLRGLLIETPRTKDNQCSSLRTEDVFPVVGFSRRVKLESKKPNALAGYQCSGKSPKMRVFS